MSLLRSHHRNHSFPPALTFRPRPSKELDAPLPDIDDEPWLHFLAKPEEEEKYADYLHFDAGILAGTESAKRKANKFRPAGSKKEKATVQYHHGAFQRRHEGHGFVENRRDPLSHIVEYDVMTASHPIDVSRQSSNRGRHNKSGHRRSWQEPSDHLFTLNEEIPELSLDESVPAIVVSDFDNEPKLADRVDSGHEQSSSESNSETSSDAGSDAKVGSPSIGASVPAEQPDSDLNQMWFGERARL